MTQSRSHLYANGRKSISSLIILSLLLSQLFLFADISVKTVVGEYEALGLEVPEINVIYVGSFSKGENVYATYTKGTIILKRGDKTLRALRHEIAHAVSLESIDLNKETFKAYADKRLKNTKIITTFYNLTGDELGGVFKLLEWFHKVTTPSEIVAEDLYHYVYGLDTLQKDYIGLPTTEDIKELLAILETP